MGGESLKRPDDSINLRMAMVEQQIRRRGVDDPKVLGAMRQVPRELFVPPEIQAKAYDDKALAIGHGQTISQPYIVAHMTEQLALTKESRVLEIGTGTGYQTAILALLAECVFTVERIDALQLTARQSLDQLGFSNVEMIIGDGTLGLPQHAPFDRILVTASAPKVPASLKSQLADGGILIAPVGESKQQHMVKVVRNGDRLIESVGLACRFVQLIGQEGWERPSHFE